MENVLEEIRHYRLVPVVAINKIEDAIPTMEALVKGGLPVAEIPRSLDWCWNGY